MLYQANPTNPNIHATISVERIFLCPMLLLQNAQKSQYPPANHHSSHF